MSALPEIIRGSNMIAWQEQPPDFARRSFDSLVAGLPFLTACAVAVAGGAAPRVIVARDVMAGIVAHLQEQRVEMGGLLLGTVHDGLSGSTDLIVAVKSFVRSVEFDGTGVSLRMDPDVWERARMQADGEATVIGWYHSHPDLGVFFSGTDRRTQRAFFNQPHSIGLVVDPIRLQEKWFIGPDSLEIPDRQILHAG